MQWATLSLPVLCGSLSVHAYNYGAHDNLANGLTIFTPGCRQCRVFFVNILRSVYKLL